MNTESHGAWPSLLIIKLPGFLSGLGGIQINQKEGRGNERLPTPFRAVHFKSFEVYINHDQINQLDHK